MGASCKSSDLSTGQFQDEYDTEKWNDYKVPDLVSARIGGRDADQKASKSWTSSFLKDIFAS
ncbi:uncharacterized protein ATNIH1004_011761 [Aspergillus tanneri]|uniref:Uncharacterized protein n=1 Tax=Aspergillus tanneri TaxID=1220188 RepID=A0A5M9M3R5_9EURO|nr:uncharacterized protein ATNIH1004_011761 [Aspergillus tanneri]KAA8641625.1 hypothetical protein ATNIH1004_011761 [Aspergillus tanneri]